MEEQRKDIPKFKGMYQASDLGNIRSLDRIIIGNYKKPYLKRGWVLFPNIRKGYHGYKVVQIMRGKQYFVHRLVASAFLGLDLDDKDMLVLHLNNNKQDCRLCNLKIGTHSENQLQAFRDGKIRMSGHLNGNAKLNRPQVEEIRKTYSAGLASQRVLAEKYSVSQMTILNVVNNRHYAD